MRHLIVHSLFSGPQVTELHTCHHHLEQNDGGERVLCSHAHSPWMLWTMRSAATHSLGHHSLSMESVLLAEKNSADIPKYLFSTRSDREDWNKAIVGTRVWAMFACVRCADFYLVNERSHCVWSMINIYLLLCSLCTRIAIKWLHYNKEKYAERVVAGMALREQHTSRYNQIVQYIYSIHTVLTRPLF